MTEEQWDQQHKYTITLTDEEKALEMLDYVLWQIEQSASTGSCEGVLASLKDAFEWTKYLRELAEKRNERKS